MRPDQAIKRVQAWHRGRPLQSYETRHFALGNAENLLIVAFVRMGGESSPWGIAWGYPGESPEIRTVPEARNRDAVAEMAAKFAPVLLQHFWSPAIDPSDATFERNKELPLRQVWLPNGSHIDMLHYLAYSYTRTKYGDDTRLNTLNALGRLAGWLFREHDRPGEMTVIAATDALRSTYIFPAEDVRQEHLGYLLAWLETSGKREKRLQAAQEAEQHSISVTIDPTLERDVLEPQVEKWNDARLSSKVREGARAEIDKVITAELKNRFELVERTIEHLREKGPRENLGVQKLANASIEERWFQYLRLELRRNDPIDGNDFAPSPETDFNPAAAASRYFVQQASQDFGLAALIHDDEGLQREALLAGDGIRGECIAVRDDGEGTRKMDAVWTIQAEEIAPLHFREGDSLCITRNPGRHFQVMSIERTKGDNLEIELLVTNKKKEYRDERGRKQPAANSQAFVGEEFTFVPVSMDEISRQKNRKIWNDQVPGSWITHAKPEGRKTKATSTSVGGDDNLFEKMGRL
jgi:hypothetical protein